MRPVNPRLPEALLPLSPAALSAVPLPQSTIGPVMKMASPPSISEEERPAVGCRKGGIKGMYQFVISAMRDPPRYCALCYYGLDTQYSPHIRVSEGMSAACFPSMYIL